MATILRMVIGWSLTYIIFTNYGLLMAIIGFFGIGMIMNLVEVICTGLVERYT